VAEKIEQPEVEDVSFCVLVPGERLDKTVVGTLPYLSRARVQKLIKTGGIAVDGHPQKPSYRVQRAEEVNVHIRASRPQTVLPEDAPIDLVYEDESLLVVNKPAGVVVHPAPGHTEGTLVNALLARYPGIGSVGEVGRAGIVHRLDKDTSGVLVVAKNEATRVVLQRAFKRRTVSKTYLALVDGRMDPHEGVIEAPIGRSRRERKRMAVVKTGRDARTAYRVRQYFAEYTLLEVMPQTGRTHQIRVHLSWMGHPVVGDRVYGRRRQRLLRGRVFLHAWRLRFDHPVTGEPVEFSAALPPELSRVLKKLRASEG
jgi:23S rRNA pseudouridine1911/1915/1917 synthase